MVDNQRPIARPYNIDEAIIHAQLIADARRLIFTRMPLKRRCYMALYISMFSSTFIILTTMMCSVVIDEKSYAPHALYQPEDECHLVDKFYQRSDYLISYDGEMNHSLTAIYLGGFAYMWNYWLKTFYIHVITFILIFSLMYSIVSCNKNPM